MGLRGPGTVALRRRISVQTEQKISPHRWESKKCADTGDARGVGAGYLGCEVSGFLAMLWGSGAPFARLGEAPQSNAKPISTSDQVGV
jgi:hypothetical protein